MESHLLSVKLFNSEKQKDCWLIDLNEGQCFSWPGIKNTSCQVQLPMMSPVRRQSVNECEKLFAIGRCNRDFSLHHIPEV